MTRLDLDAYQQHLTEARLRLATFSPAAHPRGLHGHFVRNGKLVDPPDGLTVLRKAPAPKASAYTGAAHPSLGGGRRVIPVESWDQAADELNRAHQLDEPDFEVRVRTGDHERQLHPDEAQALAKLATEKSAPQAVSMYHVAPRVARASIAKHGLDPVRGEFRSEQVPGVYAFTDKAEAEWYARYQASEAAADDVPMEFDIWAFEGEPGATDTGLRSAGDDDTTAVYLPQPIPTKKLRRL